VTNTTQPRPFDERAALDELERLAERIQASRRQREQAVAEFDAFVKTFRDDQYAARLRAVETADAAVQPAPPPAPEPPPVAPRSLDVEPSFPAFPSETAEAGDALAPPSQAQPAMVTPREPAPAIVRSSSTVRSPRADLFGAPYARWVLAAAGLLLIVLLIMWMRSGSAPPTQASTPPAPGPVATDKAAVPAVPTPVASSGPPRALNVQLIILRPVWARVTVDDKKMIERELAGGQTIPLGADRVIAIRAGDAGAVRVTVDGKDQGLLGRDGQPATRTFTAPTGR
jgi:RodZ C-terminal domain